MCERVTSVYKLAQEFFPDDVTKASDFAETILHNVIERIEKYSRFEYRSYTKSNDLETLGRSGGANDCVTIIEEFLTTT